MRVLFVLFAGLVIAAGGLAAGCQARPSAAYSTGDVLLHETFERGIGWDNLERDNVRIGVEAGAYRLRADVNAYVRGFGSTLFEDVVIEVEGIQLTPHRNNAFGIVCRGVTGDDSANGYYFLIGGDGSYSIRKGQFGEVSALVHWSRSNAVQQGVATNRIRAICSGDYLALYVNDQFLADVRDTTYSTGFVGFALATSQGSTSEIAFDNLIIREATLVDGG